MRDLLSIYVINLERRPIRRTEMTGKLVDLRLAVEPTFFRAIDGRELSDKEIARRGLRIFPNWSNATSTNRYHRRGLKLGEIGCTLSHLAVWKRIADAGRGYAMVLEDDVNFCADFAEDLASRLDALEQAGISWQFLYLGREHADVAERWIVDGVVAPSFSYCSYGYLLTSGGAAQLLAGGLGEAILPVDEFLPAMYCDHPRSDVRVRFGGSSRIKAFACRPPLVEHAGSRVHRISDTEHSAGVEDLPAPERN